MKTFIPWLIVLVGLGGVAQAFNPGQLKTLLATKSCPGCDLSGANLSHKDLRKANLEKANLKGVKLVFTKFDEANLRGANLDGANIMRVDFWGADLEGAILTNIKKGDMMFQGANLRGVDFTNSNLTKGRFGSETRRGKRYPPADITGAVFKGATLDWRMEQRIKQQQKAASPAQITRQASRSDQGPGQTGTGKRFTVPDSAIVRGGPNKGFLGAELYVVAGGSPMAGGFSVHQIVDALGKGKKSWEAFDPGQWMLTFKKEDRMTGKRLILKMLFIQHRGDSGEGVLISRIIANGQELNKGQIFQFMRQRALKAEAKQ